MRLFCGQNYTFAFPRTVPKMSILGKWPGKRAQTRNLPFPEWQLRTDAALSWLRRSIEVTGGKGSSHSYRPLFGWEKAYPETTGYLIETLFDYAVVKQDDSLRGLAFGCADWLVSIQLPGGAFPGLLVGNKEPSVFNTSQILFGLSRAVAEDRGANQAVFDALLRATDWLLSQLEPDSSWRKHGYVPGFTPSYYTRAVWAVLKANQVIQKNEIQEVMRSALLYYAERILPNGAVMDWGFRAGKPAFTHTVAYTLEGFLESAVLLKEKKIIEKKILTGEKLLSVVEANKGRTAGCYDERWRGDYSFLCTTGNCQLSVFYWRLWELTGREDFKEGSHRLLMEIIDCQRLGNNLNTYGALPGSAPVWGPYARFRYPNWGVKFLLDALRAWRGDFPA